MSDKEVNYKETLEKLKELFLPQGKGCGKKVAEVLRNRGHEVVIPLYRSAIVLEVKTEGEYDVPHLSITAYDDPHWMGAEEINDETVSDEGVEYGIFGQRSGIQIYKLFEQELSGQGQMFTEKFYEDREKLDKKLKEGSEE